MRSYKRGKQFPGEFPPEMVEEILQRAADTAVIIRRTQDENIRRFNPRLQRRETGLTVSRLHIKQGQRLFAEVKHVHFTTRRAQIFCYFSYDHTRDRCFMRASDDSKDFQRCFRHKRLET